MTTESLRGSKEFSVRELILCGLVATVPRFTAAWELARRCRDELFERPVDKGGKADPDA